MKNGIYNAKVDSVSLGREDHGIMTSFVTLDYGHSCQGFGGWGLSEPPYLFAWITEVLRVAGADDWKKVPGKYVRAKIESGFVVGIGHITNDEIWFEPRKVFEEIQTRSKVAIYE